MLTLTVYKASAGSGKTFTLATQFIERLVANPSNYRSVLAVTFTNKATDEMKLRILSQLYGLWKRLPDSQSYMDHICSDLGFGQAQVAKRAGEALMLLLHDYSSFWVMTIDSFFQIVMRTLAKELGLAGELHVDLNDRQAMEHAVDSLLSEMNTPAGKQLRGWVGLYMRETIDNGDDWNVVRNIKGLGKKIFTEPYRENAKSLAEALDDSDGGFTDYLRMLDNTIAKALRTMADYGQEGMDALERAGLTPADFAQGATKSAASRFAAMANPDKVFDKDIFKSKYVQDAVDDDEAWIRSDDKKKKNADRRALILGLVQSDLSPLLRKAVEDYPKLHTAHNTAVIIRRNIHQLRLLHKIEERVRQECDNDGRFLLSDTQQLLARMVGGSDAPFVFEKIGAQMNHIMIDEFQDTSLSQWRNFSVLLRECMSRGGRNLVVGDVKQSIYRWRSGDWRLLAGFKDMGDMVKIENLDTNYRSQRGVVEFNNEFFTAAVEQECLAMQENNISADDCAQMAAAYSDVRQKVPAKRADEGLVRIKMLTEEDYKEHVADEVAAIVHELLEAGAEPGDIAIICRTNKEIEQLVAWFFANDPEIQLVSDEAFRLGASPAVNMMVETLRHLLDPADNITSAYLRKRGAMTGIDDPIVLIDANADSLLSMSVPEALETIYDLLHIQNLDGQTAYICAFFDAVAQFTDNYVPTTDAFIAEWDENMSLQKIDGDVPGGVRILTIHQSKGLEFDNVIVPFCNWKHEKPTDLIWAKPTVEPFSRLPIVPVPHTDTMCNSIFHDAYIEEALQVNVDNMNMLYVAFTRASRNLFAIGRSRGKKGNRSLTILKALESLAATLPGLSVKKTDAEPEEAPANTKKPKDPETTLEYTYGTLSIAPKKAKEATKNVFLTRPAAEYVEATQRGSAPQLLQARRADNFTGGDSDRYINIGLAAHNVLQHLRNADGLGRELEKLRIEGVLSATDSKRVGESIARCLAMPEVAGWFAEGADAATEQTILTRDEATGRATQYRPDRVVMSPQKTIVVDFKTGRPRDEHKAQVQGYMRLLSAMGYKNVEGRLLYVMEQKIVNVD